MLEAEIAIALSTSFLLEHDLFRNRFPLFGIMLYTTALITLKASA